MNDNSSTSIPDISFESVDVQNIAEICSMALMGILGTSSGIWGLIVVQKNSFLKGLVKHYMLLDLLNLLLVNVCHLFWAVPCAIWKLDTVVPLLNYIIADVAFTLIVLGYNPKLFLGINRLLSISFGGRFFSFFDRLKYLQYAIMIGFPLIVYILFMLPGCHAAFFADGLNFFWVEGDCGNVLNYYIGVVLGYFYLPSNTIVDLTVFFMLHRRVRAANNARRHQTSAQKAENLRKEYRLAGQMVTNLITGLILNFSIAGFSSFTSPLAIFIASTLFWQLCSMIACLSYAILLQERKSLRRTIRVVSIITSTTAAN